MTLIDGGSGSDDLSGGFGDDTLIAVMALVRTLLMVVLTMTLQCLRDIRVITRLRPRQMG